MHSAVMLSLEAIFSSLGLGLGLEGYCLGLGLGLGTYCLVNKSRL